MGKKNNSRNGDYQLSDKMFNTDRRGILIRKDGRTSYVKAMPTQNKIPNCNVQNTLLRPIKFHHYRPYLKNNFTTYYKHFWSFKCACGNKTIAEKSDYKKGKTRSCGCINHRNQNKEEFFKSKEKKPVNPPGRPSKDRKVEMITMYTGNSLKEEGPVEVTTQQANEIWAGLLKLEDLVTEDKLVA